MLPLCAGYGGKKFKGTVVGVANVDPDGELVPVYKVSGSDSCVALCGRPLCAVHFGCCCWEPLVAVLSSLPSMFLQIEYEDGDAGED